MGSNKVKKPWSKLSREIKSKNLYYCKVGRSKTLWGAIAKFRSVQKIILHFGAPILFFANFTWIGGMP